MACYICNLQSVYSGGRDTLCSRCYEGARSMIAFLNKLDDSANSHGFQPNSYKATRSEIFRTWLESDECKAKAEETISLPELNYEELQCFLEFLYSGNLPREKAEKHALSLLIAADKYDIPFLKKFCEQWILKLLGPSNVLEVLEVSEVYSNGTLKEQAMNFVVKHWEDVVYSTKYDAFALKNAHLCVEITRALLKEKKDKRVGAASYVTLKF